jgi:hypothetical protein
MRMVRQQSGNRDGTFTVSSLVRALAFGALLKAVHRLEEVEAR